MSKIKLHQNPNKEKKILWPSHHSSPELRVPEKLSTNGHKLKI